MRLSFKAGLWLAAVIAAGLAAGEAGAVSELRIAPVGPDRILAQKPPQPGGAQPTQPQQEPESDEPLRLEALPSGEDLDAFVQRAIRPGFDIRSFQRVPNANGVYQVQTGDRALPSFFVNLVEEMNVIEPEQAVEHFQRGFGTCRDTAPGERFDESGLIIQSFTSTCRTQSGNEVFLFMIAGRDDQRTQVLTFMVDPRFADALRPRAEQVFQSIVSGG